REGRRARPGLRPRHPRGRGDLPREAIVKITKAEPGGLGGQGLWLPASLGLRPRYESAAMRKYLAGKFVTRKES
ncbi:MAG: hypothetical protein K6T59_03810, partial [Bryobacteraceae bacterium]|nr:hypothetical protein [Bryobacteraceae bacterium]